MFEGIVVHTNKINAVEYFRASRITHFICTCLYVGIACDVIPRNYAEIRKSKPLSRPSSGL